VNGNVWPLPAPGVQNTATEKASGVWTPAVLYVATATKAA
jgi:hypothetical protein